MKSLTMLIAASCLLAAGCSTATMPTTPSPFTTKQVIGSAYSPYLTGYSLLPLGAPDIWSTYSAGFGWPTSIYSPYFAYPYSGFLSPYFGTAGGYGWNGIGSFGGLAGSFGRIHGVAEQNDVAFRPIGSQIWQPK
jgi:hypothetical protein